MFFRNQMVSIAGIGCFVLSFAVARLHANPDLANRYQDEILPVFVEYCYDCHGDGLKKGHLALDRYGSIEEMIADRRQWKKIRDHIDFRLMPPPDEFAPSEEERSVLVEWIDEAVFPVDAENPDPGHVTLRRLNRNEYRNTVRDLLGVTVPVTEILPADDSGYGFDHIGDVLTLSPLHMERYLEAAQYAVDRAGKGGGRKIFGIERGERSDHEYMLSVVRKIARKAFRRPLKEGEAQRYLVFLDDTDEEGRNVKDVEAGIRAAVTAILVSPSFLFREEAVTTSTPGSKVLINEHALATRLSYFLWSSMPDRRLRMLADQGELRANINSEIDRMLESPKSKALVDDFFGQWLQLRDLGTGGPSSRTFPEFDREMVGSMRKETELFIGHLIEENLPVDLLLEADFSFLNQQLASLYGIKGVEGERFRRVSLEGTPRRGLLGQGSVLALTSHPNRTSPVLRGKYVLENLLNTPPPPAPPNVPALESDGKGKPVTQSLREELERHRDDPNCASCHALMDPIGFGLENFNAIGKWRTEDRGAEIDSSGKLVTGQKFESPQQLSRILVEDYRREFHRSVATKMLTYALGRGVEYYDRPAIEKIVSDARRDEARFNSWIRAVVGSVPFQYKRD